MRTSLKQFLLAPFVRELPFFCFSYFLLLPNVFTAYMKDDLRLGRFLQPFSCDGVDNTTALLFAYLLTILVCLCRNHLVKWVLYALGIATATVRLFLYISYKMWITSSTLALLQETNANESREFFESYVLSTNGAIALCFMLFITGIIVIAERRRERLARFMEKSKLKYLLGVVCMAVLCLAVYNLKFYSSIYTSKTNEEASNWLDKYGYPYTARGHNTVLDLFVAYKLLQLSREEDESVSEYALKFDREATAESTEDSITVVYVLGESYIKSHAHLYGYELPTTPYLDEERELGRLFIFSDVVAPFNLTYKVEKNTFFCNSIADGEHWVSSPSFMQLFKKAGFFVGFYDNQRSGKGFKLENINGSRIYNRDVARLSYSDIAEHSCKHDGDFIDDVLKKGIPTASRSLHVYHLMGQHGPAGQRFPQQFSKFKAQDVKRQLPFLDNKNKSAIATYDNATLYNDHVIHKIIEIYKDKNAALVYMSDHGEEMYDYRNSAGRAKAVKGMEAQMARHQFGVPFMIWLSDQYKAKHPEKVEAIKSALDRPFMTDNVAQVLFDLAGLKTPYYKADRDLISPQFKPRKRIIDDSGSMVCDYDRL